MMPPQDNELVSVHRRPDSERMPLFQRNYGLWIFAAGKGCSSPPDSYYRVPNRYYEFYCLSQMYSGAGKFYVSGQGETEISPGDCLIITPGAIHRYGGGNGLSYREDTVNFIGPIADMLMRSGILKTGLVHAGTVRRLLPVIDAALNPAPDSQLRANIELQQLLVNFYLETQTGETADKTIFDRLIRQIEGHLDRWWTVEEMAEYCNLSCGRLRRLFLKFTGETPKFHLDRLKLRHAGKLLASTDMKITEIAAMLGYVDEYHFARRFKSVMGVSPGKYRRNP